jgi:hypothetical protein
VVLVSEHARAILVTLFVTTAAGVLAAAGLAAMATAASFASPWDVVVGLFGCVGVYFSVRLLIHALTHIPSKM